MRIATNLTRDYLGGITRSNISFIKSLEKNNDKIIGIELNPKRYTESPKIFKDISSNLLEHHVINIHDFSIRDIIKNAHGFKDLEKKFRPIINIIKKIFIKTKPDVLFLNGTYYIPWLISIAAYELKIPIVLRYAGVYTKETENFKPKSKVFFNKIEKSFKKRVDYFIFPSILCKNVVEKEIYKKSIEKCSVIPNSVNIPIENFITKCAERRIAAIGRWDNIKNFKTFFKIHKKLLKDGWIHDASFITNDKKINNFPKTINRFTEMNHDELIKFYSSQGLIISPSLFETFGNVPMEAACMGIPVLVNENMGCSEILKMAGLENMIISFDNLNEVTKRVKSLCGQQILPKQINNLKKILDPQLINTEIISILRNNIKSNF